jgi:hypothetical protein
VGGQKRLDRRYKDQKVWLARNYFQVYYKERNWEPDPRDRIVAAETNTTPTESREALPVPHLATVSVRRRAKTAH